MRAGTSTSSLSTTSRLTSPAVAYSRRDAVADWTRRATDTAGQRTMSAPTRGSSASTHPDSPSPRNTGSAASPASVTNADLYEPPDGRHLAGPADLLLHAQQVFGPPWEGAGLEPVV